MFSRSLNPVLPLLVALALGATAVGAQAQKLSPVAASLAGPSVVKSSTAAVYSGTGFAPNAALSTAVKAPGGIESHYSAVAGADGKLSYRLQPGTSGVYTITVLDSGGLALSSTRVNVIK